MKNLLSALALVAASGAVAADRRNLSDLKIGPLNLGMTETEVKAILPKATQDGNGPVEAPAAIDLVGLRMDVSYGQRFDGTMRIELTSHWSVQPGQCMAKLAAVVGALEPVFGPFGPDEVKGYTVLPAGARSKMGWFVSRGFGGGQDGLVQASAFVRGEGKPIEVNAQANEERNLDPDADGRLECTLFVHIRHGA